MSFICHIHNYTEYSQQWNVFSAFNPHLEQWAAVAAAPGEQSGVQCLAQGSHLSRGQFLPEPRFEPTTSGYKSNTLSTRPRLPHHEEFTTWNRTPISSTGGDSSTPALPGWIWQEIRDHSFIQNLSKPVWFPAPWRCFFSSVHLTHFLQVSGQWP